MRALALHIAPEQVAALYSVSPRSLNNWIRKFNKQGIDGLIERPRNIIICDNASWHKKKSLDWGAFEPVFLPPYSPDLNPMERLWLLIKAEWFADFFAKTRQQLLERIDQALLWAMNRPDGNKTTCSLERFT